MNSKNKAKRGGTDPFRSKDLKREYKTVKAMIKLYCRKVHKKNVEDCDDCRDLLIYAEDRIRKCPHYQNKIPCKQCTIHCYRDPYKTGIRRVMSFSGPRIIYHHPVLAVYHILARYKKDKLADRRSERV